MARDSDGILTQKWAATGDVQQPPFQRTEGWPSAYSQAGGPAVARLTFNQLFRELSALAIDLNKQGVLCWDTSITYDRGARVVGTDFKMYEAVTANSGNDPVSDDGTNWASTGVEFASNSETQGGLITDKAVTPAGLASVHASTSLRGLVELATNAEAIAGTDAVRGITPAALAAGRGATGQWETLVANQAYKRPDGIIEQYGSVAFTTVGDSTLNITFPTSFNSDPISYGWTVRGAAQSQVIGTYVSALSNTGMTILSDKNAPSTATITANWWAIGI